MGKTSVNVLDGIIAQMEAGQTKTASTPAQDPAAAGPLPEASQLQAALTKAAGTPEATPDTKVDPVEALMDRGRKLAAAEKEANMAEAQMLGAAFADGFIAKMATFEKSAAAIPAAPVAPAAPAAPQMDLRLAAGQGFDAAAGGEIQKVAGAVQHVPEEDLRMAAAEVGYQNTMEKVSAQYESGHDAAIQEVGNVAYNEFLKGAAETDILLDDIAAAQK